MPQITLDLDRAKSIHGALVWMCAALELNNINMEFGVSNGVFDRSIKEDRRSERELWLALRGGSVTR